MTIRNKKIVIGEKILLRYKFILHKVWKLNGPMKWRWMKTWHGIPKWQLMHDVSWPNEFHGMKFIGQWPQKTPWVEFIYLLLIFFIGGHKSWLGHEPTKAKFGHNIFVDLNRFFEACENMIAQTCHWSEFFVMFFNNRIFKKELKGIWASFWP
jgi:hypothetical protein